MNSDDLAEATHAAKATEALLRDARSALPRVEKLTDAALDSADADAHPLAEAAQHTLEQLVGQLRQRYREGQDDQLGALGLVGNAIVLWNTRDQDAARDQLRRNGHDVRDDDLRRLSPVAPRPHQPSRPPPVQHHPPHRRATPTPTQPGRTRDLTEQPRA